MNECFAEDPVETEAAVQGIGVVTASRRAAWDATVAETLQAATLALPPASSYVSTGKLGVHSEHMSYLLGEMQGLARAHPGTQW
ncbi:1,2-phenylacetyl-CoA epoxidase, subunit C [compost metagenome]